MNIARNTYLARKSATRRAIRRAIAHGYASAWSPVIALMREIDNSPAMLAFRKREDMMARIGSVGGADIGNAAYA